MRYPLLNHSAIRYALPPLPHSAPSIWQSALDRLRNAEPEETWNARVHFGRTQQRPDDNGRFANYDGTADAHTDVRSIPR
jgi:hypothetical protein